MDSQIEQTIPDCDGAAVVERNDMYFFEFVVFQVQNTLFSVPKNGFLDSNPAFFEKYAPSKTTDVASETYPIELKDITAESFKGLLLVLYPFKRTAETYEEWLGALDLATRWDLADVRTKAINTLSKLNKGGERSTVEILLLAKKYHIKEWLVEIYISLIQNGDLNLNVLRQQEPGDDSLDWETMARLFSVRLELIQWTGNRPDCSTCGKGKAICAGSCNNKSKKDATMKQARDLVYSAFADEIAGMPDSPDKVKVCATLVIPMDSADPSSSLDEKASLHETEDKDKISVLGSPPPPTAPSDSQGSFHISSWNDSIVPAIPLPQATSAPTKTRTNTVDTSQPPILSVIPQVYGQVSSSARPLGTGQVVSGWSGTKAPRATPASAVGTFALLDDDEKKNGRSSAPVFTFGRSYNK